MRIWFLGFFWLFAAGMSFAQPLHLSFDQIGLKDGLSPVYNDFIFKDSRGFMWFSSLEGWHKYDGLETQFYPHGSKEEKGIKGKYIQSTMLEDAKGDLWFSTFHYFNCYRWKEDCFSSFRLVDPQSQDTIKAAYSLIHLEKDSVLWLKAGNDIYTYNIHSAEYRKVRETKGARFAVDTLVDGTVKNIYACLWENGSGFEWIQIEENGTSSIDTLLREGFPEKRISQIKIFEAIVTSPTEVWLLSKHGLIKFNPQDPVPILRLLPDRKDKVVDGVSFKENFLLFVAKNSGFLLYDIQQDKFSEPVSQDQFGKLVSNDIRQIYITTDEHVWISSDANDGVENSWIYRNIFENPLAKAGTDRAKVTSLVEDGEQRIWCATKQEGIFIFEQDGSLSPQAKDESKRSKFSDKKRLEGIRQLSVDREGLVWGVSDRYIYHFSNGVNFPEILFDAGYMKIYDFAHLSKNEKLILTDAGTLLLSFDQKDSKFYVKDTIIASGTSQLFQMFEDRDSFVYYPNNNNVLQIYNKGQGIPQEPGEIRIDFNVYSIWKEEKSDVLWIGTEEGLFFLEEKTHKFISPFSEKDLLWRTQVFDVTGDENGHLWLSTSKGLWRYNIEEKESWQFRREDGIHSDQFSVLFAHIRATDGKIWLGSNQGLVVFHPDSIRPNPFGPTIKIKELKVNNKVHKLNISNNKEPLAFEHDENNLVFNVAAINSYLPKLSTIHYQLEGYGQGWQRVQNGDPISFFNILPGDYTLNIQGCNANGIKGEMYTLKINIAWPFWKTFEGLLLGLLLFVGVICLVVWLYARKQRLKFKRVQEKQRLAFEKEQEDQRLKFEREQEKKDAIQKERNRISSEMHDDLGGELNTIQILLRRVQKNELSENISGLLKKAEGHASKSSENMREIIWAMNNSYEQLPELIAYTRRFVLEYFDAHQLNCRANIPAQIPNVAISGEKRKHIFLCVKESAHNIVKHAQAKEVEVSFQWENGLKIIIQDDGKGIEKESQNGFGNGLKNMENRMTKIGGQLRIEDDNGTRLIFEIPLPDEGAIP